MKRRKKFLLFFIAILCFICSISFLIFKNNGKENKMEKEEKNIQKPEAKKEKEQPGFHTDSSGEIPEDVYQNFTRGKERYTEKSILYGTNMEIISLEDPEDICKETGCNSYMLKEYLTAFICKKHLTCNSGKILDYCYAQTPDASRKIYIFIQLDDADRTLATAIFEPATRESSAYYDALPCQYSREEINGQTWYKKEEQ